MIGVKGGMDYGKPDYTVEEEAPATPISKV